MLLTNKMFSGTVGGACVSSWLESPARFVLGEAVPASFIQTKQPTQFEAEATGRIFLPSPGKCLDPGENRGDEAILRNTTTSPRTKGARRGAEEVSALALSSPETVVPRVTVAAPRTAGAQRPRIDSGVSGGEWRPRGARSRSSPEPAESAPIWAEAGAGSGAPGLRVASPR